MSSNLVLIDSKLKDTDILVSALNTQTIGIVYNYDTSRNDLLSQIETKFTDKTIQRIAICCHEGETRFLENETFFSMDNEVIKNANTQFIIDLLIEYNVVNIDYLACSSLKYDSWKDYFDLIGNETQGVTVGASEDETGNLKYGGNWLMENTGEQIDTIYFNKGLEYYKHLLLSLPYYGMTRIEVRYQDNYGGNWNTEINVLRIPKTVTYIGWECYTFYRINTFIIEPVSFQVDHRNGGLSNLDYRFITNIGNYPTTIYVFDSNFNGFKYVYPSTGVDTDFRIILYDFYVSGISNPFTQINRNITDVSFNDYITEKNTDIQVRISVDNPCYNIREFITFEHDGYVFNDIILGEFEPFENDQMNKEWIGTIRINKDIFKENIKLKINSTNNFEKQFSVVTVQPLELSVFEINGEISYGLNEGNLEIEFPNDVENLLLENVTINNGGVLSDLEKEGTVWKLKVTIPISVLDSMVEYTIKVIYEGKEKSIKKSYNTYAPIIGGISAIEIINNIPETTTEDDKSIIIPSLSNTSQLTIGSVSERRAKRKEFVSQMIKMNKGKLKDSNKKIVMNTVELLGENDTVKKSKMRILDSYNSEGNKESEISFDVKTLGLDEGLYVPLDEVGESVVLSTINNKIRIVKASETTYDVYEGYVDESSVVTKTMNEEDTGEYDKFKYVLGSVGGEVIPVTITVGDIEYPSITSEVKVEFSTGISESEINSLITKEPSRGSSLSTMTSSDGGKTWRGTLTGETGYVVKGASISINYTEVIRDSATYDIVMTEDGKGWNEIFSITDGTNSDTGLADITCNKSGTIFAVDTDTVNYNAENGIYPRVKVYEYDGTNWNQKGLDLIEANKNMVLNSKVNDIGDHIIINMSPGDGTVVYKWDGSSWVQKGSSFTHQLGYTGKPEITADGNMIGLLGQDLTTAYVYEYDNNTSDWILKGSALDLTGYDGYGCGKISINNEKTILSFIKGKNIYTYKWNDVTSLWELEDTLYLENLFNTNGIERNYGGNIVAFQSETNDQWKKLIYIYEWNGTSLVQLGSIIEINNTFQRLNVALDETGHTIAIGGPIYNGLKNTIIYKYDGTDWNLSSTINYHSRPLAISGNGERLFMSNGYVDKSVSVQENGIGNKINKMSMTPSAVRFPESTSEIRLEFSHRDLTSTEVGTNVSISDVNLGSLGGFTSSEGGYVWKSTFTGANIEGSGTIEYSYSGMTGSVALTVDTLEKAISNICFNGDAKVLTESGYKLIREVKKGMKVGGEEVEEVTMTISKEEEIVLMKKGSIMRKMPLEDTRITKEHKVLYKGEMKAAKELVNGETILYEEYKGETLYNILLKGEGKMVVNGMIVETLSPSNNIAKLYKILKGYKEEEKKEIIRIYNEERGSRKKGMSKNKK